MINYRNQGLQHLGNIEFDIGHPANLPNSDQYCETTEPYCKYFHIGLTKFEKAKYLSLDALMTTGNSFE